MITLDRVVLTLGATLALALFSTAISSAADGHLVQGSGKTEAVACGADQSEVTVQGSGNTVTVTGMCTKVSVSGSGNKVTVELVDELAIAGANNTADAESAGKISVGGSGNKVTWKKAIGTAKAPTVSKKGAGNSVEQAK
jgi:hypothetical protein